MSSAGFFPSLRAPLTFFQDTHCKNTVWGVQNFCGFKLLVTQQSL